MFKTENIVFSASCAVLVLACVLLSQYFAAKLVSHDNVLAMLRGEPVMTAPSQRAQPRLPLSLDQNDERPVPAPQELGSYRDTVRPD